MMKNGYKIKKGENMNTREELNRIKNLYKESNRYILKLSYEDIGILIRMIDALDNRAKMKSKIKDDIDSKLKHDLKSINKKLHEPGVCIYRYYILKGMKTKTQEILKYLQKTT